MPVGVQAVLRHELGKGRRLVVASLGQPLMYLLALGFGLGPVFQRAGNGSYLQFVAPGVISMPSVGSVGLVGTQLDISLWIS